METFEAIHSRRNVREFDTRPISDADLDRIMDAAWRTPSSRNSQRWEFVVSTDRSTLQRLSGVWRGAGHVAGAAAAVALVSPLSDDIDERGSIEYDLGQATMSVMLAAADLGIATAHASVADQALARDILGLPGDRRCAWLISLGYPAGRPLRPITRPDRRPFEDVVRRERF
ncbi:MAG: nitroreductase family protein [Acidimicrobiia bacterium]|nr:nitroreductase family protein [Acidimicrobiia bacterium]MDH4308594.1 nitroreductase family protein [Acidimicrobiia bacterium]